MTNFADTISSAPRNARGGIDWRSMEGDAIAAVFVAAVAIDDKRTERQAHRAGFRTAMRAIKADR